MPRIPSIPSLAAMVLLCSACSDFLAVEPEDTVAADFFYRNETEANLAVVGLYDGLQNVYAIELIEMTELTTDNMRPGDANAINTPLDEYLFDARHGTFRTQWNRHYAAILQANSYLAREEKATMSQAARDRLAGEAKAIRALMYFNLVRFYGDVPLVLEPIDGREAVKRTRTPAAEVYAQILQDLADAERSLPRANGGRFTSGAAKTMIGLVHLTRRDYPQAAAKFSEVIASGAYSLEPNFADVWDDKRPNSPESILRVYFFSGDSGEGTQLPMRIPRRDVMITFGGLSSSGNAEPSDDIEAAFTDKTNPRYLNTLNSDVTNRGVTYPHAYVRKFMQDLYGPFQSGVDFIVLRYADVLLKYAEAVNEANGPTGEAYAAVNQVRRRAYGLPLNNPSAKDLPHGLSKEAFREAVWNEQRLEVAFEGHRWFDLVRTDRLTKVVNAYLVSNDEPANVRECHSVFPIPHREIEINPKLTQNECYN